MTTKQYSSLSALLYFEYGLSAQESIYLMTDWLRKNPQKSYSTLLELLQSRKIILKDKALLDMPQLSLEEAKILAGEIQTSNEVKITDRWYHLRCYRQCFIGSELVNWLMTAKGRTLEESIALGQNLLEHHLISHVCQDHDFKNEFLFYHFIP